MRATFPRAVKVHPELTAPGIEASLRAPLKITPKALKITPKALKIAFKGSRQDFQT